jgi:hypothetical protein
LLHCVSFPDMVPPRRHLYLQLARCFLFVALR